MFSSALIFRLALKRKISTLNFYFLSEVVGLFVGLPGHERDVDGYARCLMCKVDISIYERPGARVGKNTSSPFVQALLARVSWARSAPSPRHPVYPERSKWQTQRRIVVLGFQHRVRLYCN